MPRPLKRRWIGSWPGAEYFKPRGIPLADLEVVSLTVDEYEAIRLHDRERMEQAPAAEMMRISRATFGRILNSAHQKIAEALTSGKAIRIGGGSFEVLPGCGAGPGFCGRGRGRRWRGGGGNPCSRKV
ncbi:MAG: DUF134 domain-containing protein [PVC group bacterium]